MQTKVMTMLTLQESMNARVNPEWRSADCEWYRAIWTECAEMLDHYGWKWWKYQESDLEQVKLELIDIWHFALSAKLMAGLSLEQTAEQIVLALEKADESDDVRLLIEKLAQRSLETHEADMGVFIRLMQLLQMDFDELFKSYVGKNVLNVFRQDHGYKQGDYIKVWQGREDNEHLVDILTRLDANADEFAAGVYQALEAVYPV
ncbi:MAG: dUTP diphosphatase [Gammaproteobacteria bacterium]|nr:dUTP diphosphatase [Gammaproteobacteria bacterium]